MTPRHLLLLSLVSVGCREASSAERTSRATIVGHAQFKDVDTDRDGAHRDMNAPSNQSATVRVTVRGTGQVDADCPDAGAGQFTASYDGTMAIERDGAFSAPLYPAAPPVFTPSGCQVRGVDVAQITDVEIAAELPASTDGCRDLCDGRGRDAGDARCATSEDRAACRVPIATAAAQQCAAACLQQATGLAGRGWLDGTALSAVSGGDLMTGSLGELRAHVVFDQMIDQNRHLVGE